MEDLITQTTDVIGNLFIFRLTQFYMAYTSSVYGRFSKLYLMGQISYKKIHP